MTSTTAEAVLSRTLYNLAQVPGVSVQLYSEDVIYEYIRTGFYMYVRQYDWPSYNEWLTATLDGTLGVVTRDLTVTESGVYERTLNGYDDIINIYPDDYETALTELPSGLSPDKVTGTSPRYYRPYYNNDKLFRIVPYTTTGDIRINFKPIPTEVIATTPLYLDPTLLTLFATHMYLAVDGTNAQASELFQAKLATREEQYANLRAKPIPLSSSARRHSVNTWWPS